MAAALARKQSRRKALRKELSSNLAECKDALDDNDCLRTILLGLKTNLEKTIDQLNEVDEQILNVLDTELIEDDVLESKRVLRPTYEIVAGLNLKLEKIALTESSTPTTASSSSMLSCKLPELEIPLFNGQALAWRGFWDQFESAIHQNESLSDVNKFNYLKRFLSGEALASISGLALSSANYGEAIDTLKRRYGNPQVLITAYMEKLLKLSKVKGKDFSCLRGLYNDVENCLRSLRSLKVETATYGSLLLPLLKEKLPDDFVLQIGRRFGTDVWTLDKFMEFFEKELVTVENCLPSLKSVDNTRKETGMFTTSSFLGQVDRKRGGSKPRCVFCNNREFTK